MSSMKSVISQGRGNIVMERKKTFWNVRSKHAVEGSKYKGRNPGRGKGHTEIMGVVKQFEKHQTKKPTHDTAQRSRMKRLDSRETKKRTKCYRRKSQ